MIVFTDLNAQEIDKIRVPEVGLTFYNLDGFGMTCRTGNKKTVCDLIQRLAMVVRPTLRIQLTLFC